MLSDIATRKFSRKKTNEYSMKIAWYQPDVFKINAGGPKPTTVAALTITTYSLLGFRPLYTKLLLPSFADTCAVLVHADSGPDCISRIHTL